MNAKKYWHVHSDNCSSIIQYDIVHIYNFLHLIDSQWKNEMKIGHQEVVRLNRAIYPESRTQILLPSTNVPDVESANKAVYGFLKNVRIIHMYE